MSIPRGGNSGGGSTSLDLTPLLDASNNSDDSDQETGGKPNGGAQLNTSSSVSSKELRSSHRDREREEADAAIFVKKVGSALFYGIASFMITVVNKTVLTSYRFPSFLFLSLGQLTASIIVLGVGKRLRLVTYPPLQRNTFAKIFPLPLIFGFNMIFGLGGTKALSLPMFAALRRFSILMTMLLELKILGVRPTTAVQISVYAMIGGALIAASDDLSFNMQGYTYVMITNALTASNGVFVKKKLDTSEIGKYGLMFYNSLFMFVPALLLNYVTGDLQKAIDFASWNDPAFVVQFLLSCVMGFILSHSTILCTQFNSALTTTIVGCLKNICVTYLGMFIGGDYVFSWLNCIGINISVMASLLYTYVTFRRKQAPDKQAHLPSSRGESV
ncbi:hypothetical protein AWZ03_000514 [Drosophila navojoa]|uniref:Sugar phosphate transporter domain-containing protein n=1 Tax=Drosophila navojoa TaxID=7232 RepID=A0A484C037_DRONA|nr:UDP-sugar transporter UST74c [Drosophila navojoa]TDG52971.1 hypothetical protein AWZ03_000514 [Drosophila navojoa]